MLPNFKTHIGAGGRIAHEVLEESVSAPNSRQIVDQVCTEDRLTALTAARYETRLT